MEFNRRPVVVNTSPLKGLLPAEKSFLSVEPSAVVLTALKTTYDSPDNLVVRLYQSAAGPCVARFTAALPSAAWAETDQIERPLTNAPAVDPLRLSLGLWDIRTYQLVPNR
jgi:alpha-mannosidase